MPILRAGPFRGLEPYGEDDQSLLFGRDQEAQELLRLTADQTISTILVTGEVASGKTSLLRAALVPGAKKAGLLPCYLECGPDWEFMLRQSLSQLLERPLSGDDQLQSLLAELASRSGTVALFILDHVEQLLWMDDRTAASFQELISGFLQSGAARVVLAVDRGNLHALNRISEGLANIPAAHTVTLGRWGKETVEKVLEQTVLGGGGYMESGLPQLIAEDLCATGPVLPAAIQVAGYAAMLNRAVSRKIYRKVGGAIALEAFFVEQLVAQVGGWRARRVLAVLSEQPSPRVLLSGEEIARRSGLGNETTQRLLAGLEERGLVRSYAPAPVMHGNSGEIPQAGGYVIFHHFLRQPIRDFSASVHRGRARAKRALRRRSLGKQLIRPNELFNIFRFLGKALDSQERLQLQRSIRIWTIVAAVLVALPILGIFMFYGILSSSSYLDASPAVVGPPRVVIRSGDPAFKFASALFPNQFDQLELDTGITLASLPTSSQQAILDHQISGRMREGDSPIPPWLGHLLEGMSPVRRAALMMLAGEHKEGGKLLQASASKQDDRQRLIELVPVLLGRSKQTLAVLQQGLSDVRPKVRLLALKRAQQLGVEQHISLFSKALTDKDSQVRLAALRSMRSLAPPRSLPLVEICLADADQRVQEEALSQLTVAAKSHPAFIFNLALKYGEAGEGSVSQKVQRSLTQLVKNRLGQEPKRMVTYLVERLRKEQEARRKGQILRWLVSVVHRIDAGVIQPAIEPLLDDPDVSVRAIALSLNARFEQVDIAMNTLEELALARRPKADAVIMRRAAATGIGLIKAKINNKRFELLKALLRDNDQTVRQAAVWSLLRVGTVGLMEIARTIKRGHVDVAAAALDDVCNNSEMSSRVVTTILAMTWKMKHKNLRQRAILCASTLASASLRLNLWLADQAAVERDHQVRRTGAIAAARAIQKGGKRLVRLARYYLRDKDPDIRQAILEAIAKSPPASPAFLFKVIQRAIKDPEPKVRAASARLLVMAAPSIKQGVQVLRTLIDDPSSRVQFAAIQAAAMLKAGPEVESLDQPVARLIADASIEEAIKALRVAQQLRLMKALKHATTHTEGAVRAVAVEALIPFTSPETTLPILETALREQVPRLRKFALSALAELSAQVGKPAVELIWRSVHSDDHLESWAAYEALGQVRGKGVAVALELLQGAIQDPSEERRRRAVEVLSRLAAVEPRAAQQLAKSVLDPALDVRTGAMAGLSAYLGQFSPFSELWQLLITSETDGIALRLALSSLAWHARFHGTASLTEKVKQLPKDAPVMIRVAANLAQALGTWKEPPEKVVNWLLGQ